MQINLKNNISIIVIAFAMTMFFSCNGNLKKIQKIGVPENEPIGVAENINLKYTDSGKIKAILKSPKMYDYSNRKFAYNEFPEGVYLELFDKDGKKSIVVADYGISYNKTGIIDLQDNVVASTPSKDTLYADQLFYDQDKEWLFTNKPVVFRKGGDRINGNGFDSSANSKISKGEVLETTGIITVSE